MVKVGLVTITFNGEKVIKDFMRSVREQDYENYILYIIDNNSTDRTMEIVQKNFIPDKTVLIKNNSNNGVAGGNNQGIMRALEEGCGYILLINNDVEFENGLISKLVRASKRNKYSVIVPKMMYYSEPDIIWFGGGFFNERMGYINYHVGMNERDNGQYKDREITYAPTCCALIHKDVFRDIGLMDEKYFVYFDDTDFWYRMMKDGRHKMYYISDVEFYHKVGSLTRSKLGNRRAFKFSDFSIQYSVRNRIYYLKKQHSFHGYLNIIYFWFRINLRFFLSGKYNINLKTLLLIQKSYVKGLKL
jgi:GT2 family glycosyltransferase